MCVPRDSEWNINVRIRDIQARSTLWFEGDIKDVKRVHTFI